ncbi:MAG TPA: hypothetical protein VHE12_13505 [bacterium]|nr:hypothetical protein [bacterium]
MDRSFFPKPFFLIGLLVLLAGCSLSPEEKVAREQALKQTVDSFSAAVLQGNWTEAFRWTDGSIPGGDQLKQQITQSWVQDGTLTNAQVSSMAWVNDGTAKVKLTWTFQSGSVESFSNETFLWTWNGNGWKYRGRALR